MEGDVTLCVAADSVATLTIDMRGRSMNLLSEALLEELAVTIDRVCADPNIKGLIITSGKPAFVSGADLNEWERLAWEAKEMDPRLLLQRVSRTTKILRRLETSGKPVVCAITGSALGGGLEVCLACHHRIMADTDLAVVGFPEVNVGLLPGAGGTQRLLRLVGIGSALQLLLSGTALSPQEALRLGIIDEIVAPEDLLSAARKWLANTPTIVQPWDHKGYVPKGPIGQQSDAAAAFYAQEAARLQKRIAHNYPAPAAILSCVYEGAQVGIDTGLSIEVRYLCTLLRNPVARNMIRTGFISKKAADKLEARPKGIPPSRVKRLGIMGAGMMGQGIALVAAQAGIDVVLLDRNAELAEQGKSYSRRITKDAVARGEQTESSAMALLDRISPTTDVGAFHDVDLLIEAVFEDRRVKEEATKDAQQVLRSDAICASNTSTLPISGLAQNFARPSQFVGLHFFSPVDRMALVEVIKGSKTSDITLARALDFVAQLRKTPIVVNDGRGFYTSRCFRTFPEEGMAMIMQGVKPALIENAGRLAGMAVGPLAVADEVSIELMHMIRAAEKADLGASYRSDPAENVLTLFVDKLGRFGRKAGAGFYDYPKGGRKVLWSGLEQHYPLASKQPPVEEVKRRLLYRQALEAVRCLEEKVISKPADGDLGAVMGWGFARHTGGPFSMMDVIGIEVFVRECDRMTGAYGPAFAPPELLLKMAREHSRFYPTSS